MLLKAEIAGARFSCENSNLTGISVNCKSRIVGQTDGMIRVVFLFLVCFEFSSSFFFPFYLRFLAAAVVCLLGIDVLLRFRTEILLVSIRRMDKH